MICHRTYFRVVLFLFLFCFVCLLLLLLLFFFFFVTITSERDSEVECSLMVRWVVGSILHGVDPLSYFSIQPVLHDWRRKGRGMCYPVRGMVNIKDPLLLIDKSSPCGGCGFSLSLSLAIRTVIYHMSDAIQP